MGLLDTLFSLLGLGGSSTEQRGRETTVSTEREPRTDTESAVKGGDADESAATGTDSGAEDDDPIATDTEAAASTGSMVDEEGPTDAAEPAEAAGPTTDDPESESGLDDPDPGSESELSDPDPESQAGTVDDGGDGTGGTSSVEVIKGIGPAYAQRLSNAGVDSVADLADADADDLAESVGLSPKRVGRWIERAQEH